MGAGDGGRFGICQLLNEERGGIVVLDTVLPASRSGFYS
jgi:hypothetical protein